MENKKVLYLIGGGIIVILMMVLIYQQYFYEKNFNYTQTNNYETYKNRKYNVINKEKKDEISLKEVKNYIDNISKKSKYKNPFISKNDIILKKYLKRMELPKLIAIIKTQNKICAILDDKILKEGDKIGNFIIVKINKNYVILKDKKQYYKLVSP